MTNIYAEKLARRYGLKVEYNIAVPGLDDTTGIEAVSVFNWGKVVVFPDNIKSPERFEQVMNHEIKGHFAIRRMLTKNELFYTASRVAAMHQGTKLYQDIVDAYGDAMDVVGEEIMANIAEREIPRLWWPRPTPPSYSTEWVQNFLQHCHNFSDLRTWHDESNLEFACCRVLG